MPLVRVLLLAALALACAAAAPAAALAQNPLIEAFDGDGDGSPDCPVYPADDPRGDRICSGQVPSFDGAPLDVDLTLPRNRDADAPLMVMLHGFGNDKHEWESTTDEGDGRDKLRWNSHWFAKHGYYVLTYTARGFKSREGSGHEPKTPPGTSVSVPNGTIRLKSREFEIRDTQYLAALVAAGFPAVDPDRVAVTGGSYGGGESWVQASRPTWTFPSECTQADVAERPAPCAALQVDPLPVLELQVAIPKYSWTDLAYGLAPNGHGGGPGPSPDPYESSQGSAESDDGDGNPVGVPKLSFLTGLTASGETRGVFEKGLSTTPSEEGRYNVETWAARVNAGDPYDAAGVEDPIIRQIRRGLTEFRSSYYQEDAWKAQVDSRKTAIFAIQGWTDDLFTAVEVFRQFKYLKRLDPRWPVELELADVGHQRGQNAPETWRVLNHQANQFLQAHINGSHEQETTVSSQPAQCARGGLDGTGQDTATMRLTGRTPEDLANGRLVVDLPPGETNNPLAVADPNGPATDPILPQPQGDACRPSVGPAIGGYTAVTPPLTDTTTYVGLGVVEVPYTLVGGTTATLNARVFDVPPDAPDANGPLVTRGTYRISVGRHDSQAGVLRLPLFGNHWPFPRGHAIRLDLTQVDQPMFRPSNVASTIVLGDPRLVLPVRESGETTVTAMLAPAG